MRLKYLFFISSLFFIACDKQIFYEFQVHNHSDFDILIDYSISQLDTVQQLLTGEGALLYTDQRSGNVVDFVGEEMYLFAHIRIIAADSIPANKDFYQREFWDFSANDSMGTYTLEINNTDF